MKSNLSILVLLLSLDFLLAGCRAKKELKASERREQTSGIGVELRRVDSLWSSIAERKTVRIEFYPECGMRNGECGIRNGECGMQNETNPATLQGDQGQQSSSLLPATGGPLRAALSMNMPADSLGPAFAGGWVGGMGAVKSIEITDERTEDRSSITATDSTLRAENHSTAVVETEKASEARQDNGTWATLAIVAAVALLVYLLIKEFLKP